MFLLKRTDFADEQSNSKGKSQFISLKKTLWKKRIYMVVVIHLFLLPV